jgi:integrase
MTVRLLDLRPLIGVSSAEKCERPVSIVLTPDGTPLVVSRLGDNVWDFYPYIPQENLRPAQKMIDWNILLPNGTRLTDPANAALLESSKDFIWSLFVTPSSGSKRPAFTSLISKVTALRPLLYWMVTIGLSRFSDMDGRTLDYVPFAKRGKSGKPATPATVTGRLSLVEQLHFQRGKFNDALQLPPWPFESAISLAGLKTHGDFGKPKTEVIPDAVMAKLANVAIDYTRNRSSAILAALRNDASDSVNSAGGVNATEFVKLRTACFIVIAMFSGVRDSEAMSIEEGCIARGKSKDDSMDVCWLHGTIYKTGVRPHRWLVPAIVAEAVAVLSQLTSPLRERLRQEEHELLARLPNSIAKEKSRLTKRLHSVQKSKVKLFLRNSRGEVAVVSGSAMNDELKRFCVDNAILDDDLQPYPLHTHQFRRTYAYFVARSELGDLLTLRDHFGHWSLDMTSYYADGATDDFESDIELLEMVAKEKISRQSEIMTDYLDSDAPLANGSHWLNDWRSSVRTAANKEELIKEYAGTITLNGTGHSWCVGNARGTGCGGLCVFEAQMCVECNYGIIGQEHRSVWQGIREQQQEAVALDDMGPGGRARAQTILNYAEKVLRRLDGQEAA